uniref:SFRICE_005991 n=1 Tax=Spodoptera frugiperda TaxID=7108 RepID=A0A2H1VBX1_SPOFR
MWKMKWVGIVFLIFQFCISTAFDELEDKSARNPEENSCVEVRAVFINCEPEESVASDAESVRFEREELFKHSVLRDCNKKLAVTVKITSEPTVSSSTFYYTSSGDEYLPIEHVFEGTNKKRIRLLDPYILRLRRELPLQAYKLRRVDVRNHYNIYYTSLAGYFCAVSPFTG